MCLRALEKCALKQTNLWQVGLKKTKVKLDFLTDIETEEKNIRRGICQFIYQHAKVNNRYMKDMIEIKNLHIFNIGKSFTWLGNVANAFSK